MDIVEKIVDGLVGEFKGEKELKNQLKSTQSQEKSRLYAELIKALIPFPDEIPNEVLDIVSFPPNFSGSFDSTTRILDIQLEDMKKQIQESKSSDLTAKNKLEADISNIKFVKNKLEEIRIQYTKSIKGLNEFKEKNMGEMNLYASQDVLDLMVIFDVTIHNAFECGAHIDKDSITVNKDRLINRMRAEIHVN